MLFEHAQDPARELCRIEREGARVTVHHHRAGEQGRLEVSDHPSFDEARAEYDREIVAVYARGYRLVRDWIDPPLRYDATLEAMIADDPHDEARWLVLADWVLTQDDVRAEIVRFEQSRRTRDASETWGQYPIALFGGAHEAQLLTGPLAVAEWQAGHVRSCRLELDERYGRETMAAFAIAPATRLVRSLILLPGDGAMLTAALLVLARAPCRPVLRRLALDLRFDLDLAALQPLFDGRAAPALDTLEVRTFVDHAPLIVEWLAASPLRRTLRTLGLAPPLGSAKLPEIAIREPHF